MKEEDDRSGRETGKEGLKTSQSCDKRTLADAEKGGLTRIAGKGTDLTRRGALSLLGSLGRGDYFLRGMGGGGHVDAVLSGGGLWPCSCGSVYPLIFLSLGSSMCSAWSAQPNEIPSKHMHTCIVHSKHLQLILDIQILQSVRIVHGRNDKRMRGKATKYNLSTFVQFCTTSSCSLSTSQL